MQRQQRAGAGREMISGLYAKIANYPYPAMKACDNALRSGEAARRHLVQLRTCGINC